MTYRILSLDGGGVYALIQVYALTALYDAKTTGNTILQDFDLATANSGGSIVLGGLIENLPLSQILDYFENETKRRSIFQPSSRLLDSDINRLLGVGPKYSAKAKLPALQTLMPVSATKPVSQVVSGIRRKTSQADLHLLIPAFDYDRNTAAFFRSSATYPGWGGGSASDNVSLSQAIHASSNAPVNYFDEPAAFNQDRYWDGAIAGCNNPVLAGVAEAIMLGQKPSDIVALSIGTGTVRLAGPPVDNPSSIYVRARTDQSVANDLGKLASSITDDPPDIASFLAHVMTGGSAGVSAPADSRIIRMNPMIGPVKDPTTQQWAAPKGWTDVQLEYLANIPMDALDPNQVQYISSYAASWIAGNAPNQPMRMDGDTLTCELGHPFFQPAAAAWNQIK